MQRNTNPFSYEGRLDERTYLNTCIVFIGIGFMLSGLIPPMGEPGFALFATLNVLFVIFPIFATMKRLRDIEKSPWIAALCVIPLVSVLLIAWLSLQPSHFPQQSQQENE